MSRKPKIVTVVGARPQFIKLAPLSRALRRKFSEYIIHTGQHYDRNMSDNFFTDLSLPRPDVNLNIGSGSQGQQTGRMIEKIEAVLEKIRPEMVVVIGDTNSTLAGALAAVKVHIPVAHVEAGLRSFNRHMPEEINRIFADHVSSLNFAPTQQAVERLREEKISSQIHMVGDTMYDACLHFLPLAARRHRTNTLRLPSGHFVLLTVHRAENVDSPTRLRRLVGILGKVKIPIIWPVHPHTRQRLQEFGLMKRLLNNPHIHVRPPLGYLDMLHLEQRAVVILTDSGGVQREAYFLRRPCLTLRGETEWIETVSSGWNILAGLNEQTILRYTKNFPIPTKYPYFFGRGDAAEKIASILKKYVTKNKS